MTQTDRQTDKTTRWAITVYEPQYDMLDSIISNIKDNPNIRMIKYQDEICPDTGRMHRQGCMLTTSQHRFKGKVPNESCRKLLPNVHIEPARDWPALLKYCEKEDTRDPEGHAVKAVSEYVRTETHDLMTDIAKMYREVLELNSEMLPEKKPTEKVTDFLTREYVFLTSLILRRNPKNCGFYGQPMPRNLWKDYRDVWIDRAISITPVPSDSEVGPSDSEEGINEIIIGTLDIKNAPQTHQATRAEEEEGSAEGESESEPEH